MVDDKLLQILGVVNEKARKHSFEVNYREAQKECQDAINAKQIPITGLVGKTIASIARGLEIEDVLIKTDDGKFIYICACESYGSIELDTHDTVSIENAHKYGILPLELYTKYKEARDAHFNQKDKANAESRLIEAVQDIGVEEARKIIESRMGAG
jgi:hypothetical protein